MPYSLASQSQLLALPRGGRRARSQRAPVQAKASKKDGRRLHQGAKDEVEESPPPSNSFAQRATAGACAVLASLSFSPPASLLQPPPALASVKYLTREEISTVELFKRATPSVVFVTALGERRDQLTLDVTETPQGAGSGIVWDTEGHVVTNFHVVKDAKELRVTVSGIGGGEGGTGSGSGGGSGGGGGEFRAKLVGADPDRDVALLQLAPFADPTLEDDEQEEEEFQTATEREEQQESFDGFGGDGDGDEGEEQEEDMAVPVASAAAASGPSASPSPLPSSSPSSSSSSSSSSSPSSPASPPPPRLPPSPKKRHHNLRPRPPLVPLRRGTSAGLEVGQTVYAIGNPFGLSSTLTKGVLSGVGREIASGITGRPLENVLQSDAAINPGKRKEMRECFFY